MRMKTFFDFVEKEKIKIVEELEDKIEKERVVKRMLKVWVSWAKVNISIK